ncbi:MAG: sulfatase [Acidobacteriota bacterium]
MPYDAIDSSQKPYPRARRTRPARRSSGGFIARQDGDLGERPKRQSERHLWLHRRNHLGGLRAEARGGLRALALLLLSLCWISACGPAGQEQVLGPGSLPYGEVVFPGSLLVAPDHNWGLLPAADSAGQQEREEHWSFRGSATLRLRISENLETPFTLYLDPDSATAAFPFVARWNGQPVEVQQDEGGNLRVTIEPAALIAGPHVLEVGREPGAGGRDRLDNVFRRVAYTVGDGSDAGDSGDGVVKMRPEERPRLQLLADFLTVSVTGKKKRKYGGLLFTAPGKKEIPLHLDTAGHFHTTVENLSDTPTTLTVSGVPGEKSQTLRLAPGTQQPWRVPLVKGSQKLVLEAAMKDGPAGLLLVGEPSFEAASSEAEAGSEPPPKQPPVILITLDTTRRDALSAYGGDPKLTPNLSEFAAAATVYERGYATAPWTLPSHASMMTGRYPSHHGAGVSQQFLSADIPTIASILRRRGYFTAGFAGGKLCSHRYGVSQGFLRYRNPQRFESAGDHLTNLALNTLERHYRKPLFLFINYFDPHAMFRAPERFENLTGVEALRAELTEGSAWERFDRGDANAWRTIIDGEAPATEGELRWMRAAYDAEVAFMDEQIGRLFHALKERDLWDQALVITVADHGELLGEGGYYSHSGRLDTELMEIPFMVKFPGQREARRSDTLVSQVDLLPTVLELLEIEPPPMDGLPLPLGSVVSALAPQYGAPTEGNEEKAPGLETPRDRHRYVLMEEHESRVHPLPPALKIAPHAYGVQRPVSRSIVWEGGGECLAGEAWNWSPVPCPEDAQPEAVLSWLYRLLGEPGKAESVGMVSAEEREGLKALGYI